jgi:elongation factor G
MSNLRNIGIVAHIDAGKTTLTEQILFSTGAISAPGFVEDGSTVADWRPPEQSRGITIGSAAVLCRWNDTDVTIIDTPGHVDFTIEVERCLTVLDAVVVVFAGTEGVQAQTQTVWNQAQKHELPAIGFVNKLDRKGFDNECFQDELRESLGIEPLPLQIPILTAEDGLLIIDVLEGCGWHWDTIGTKQAGRRGIRVSLDSDELQLERMIALERIGDLVSKYDDGLLGQLLVGEEPSTIAWCTAIRKATIERACLPLAYGVARAGVGVTMLLDAIVQFLPSPEEAPQPQVYDLHTGSELGLWNPERHHLAPSTAAFVFKTEERTRGSRMAWIKVFQGTLKAGDRLLRAPDGQSFQIPSLVRIVGGEETQIASLGPGSVGGILSGAQQVLPLTGETLLGPGMHITFESIHAPTPVIAIALEAANLQDDAKMRRALDALVGDDPSLAVLSDRLTGQTLLAGMGELHLSLSVESIREAWQLDVRTRPPRARRRHMITRCVKGMGQCAVKTAPSAEVELEISLQPARNTQDAHIRYGPNIEPPPKGEWRSALEAAVEHVLSEEADVIGVQATIETISFRGSALTPKLFWSAGGTATRHALQQVELMEAEPWMRLSIVVPDRHVGAIANDLARRRGKITRSLNRGGLQILTAEAPLEELIQYATELRSLSAGRASFTMEPIGYQLVPARGR